MRTTVRIDDDVLRELKERARLENRSVTRLLNDVLRRGLAAGPTRRVAYREKTFAMGSPQVDLDKALALAAALEDEEVLRKLAARK